MKVLIACEYSGTVRDAFIAAGHDAMSCDLLPTEKPGPHYQGDVLDILDDGWDLLIGHPPCTYLSVSGIHWNNRGRGWDKTEKALEFFRLLLDAPIARIAIENPVGIVSSRIRKPDQIIQPYRFGHNASKATCLWLKNLPKLQPTRYVPPRLINGNPDGITRLTAGKTNCHPAKIAGSCAARLTLASPLPWLVNGA